MTKTLAALALALVLVSAPAYAGQDEDRNDATGQPVGNGTGGTGGSGSSGGSGGSGSGCCVTGWKASLKGSGTVPYSLSGRKAGQEI